MVEINSRRYQPMAISTSTAYNSNHVYNLSIILTFIIPIIAVLIFNLVEISPLNHNDGVLTNGDGTFISTKEVIELFNPISTWRSPEAFQSQSNADLETYDQLSDLVWKDYEYEELSETLWHGDDVGFLAPNSSAVTSNSTKWNANTGPQLERGQYGDLISGSTNHDVSDTVQIRSDRIAVVSLFAMLIIFLFLFALCIFLRNKRLRPNNDNEQLAHEIPPDHVFESCSPRQFTFEELSRATNNFHHDRMLGAGGFGEVYKADLPNGKLVAVKRVSTTSQQGIKEYKAEVTIVSRSNHRNLVQLIGWCHEREGELLVVYELMENGSLDSHLFNSESTSLSWDIRYKIANGLAKALRYLHQECGQRCVLHMDIKSSNVLLDSNFEPKLGDFGLAKVVDHGRSMELSVLAGTRGYLAPECVLTGKVSRQSDVYSYGVVALELATGRRTIDANADEDQKVLVKWVQNLYKTGRILESIDPRLGDCYNELQAKGLMVLGLWCVHHDFRERPSMEEIVRVLEHTHDPLSDLQIPSLVHDSVPRDFDSIIETISSIDLVGDTVLPENEDPAYSPLFMWRQISVLRLFRYLLGITWFRSTHHG